MRRRASRALPASVHRGKRAEGSRAGLDLVFCALLRSFFSQKRRQFPHHAATNFHSSSAVIRSWSHVLAMRTHCCSTFESSAYLSGQNLLTFQVIYQLVRSIPVGNLGQCSDKSGPMIGKWVQSWDRPTNWPADELVPRVHCTLEMEIQEIRRASHV